MQVHVKTRRTEIKIEGEISKKLLSILKKDYGNKLIIEDDEWMDITETEWYKKIKARMKSNDYMRVYRETRGLTQDQLGKRLGGISRQNISAMEKGRRPIGKEAAKKLAEVFNTSVEKFL